MSVIVSFSGSHRCFGNIITPGASAPGIGERQDAEDAECATGTGDRCVPWWPLALWTIREGGVTGWFFFDKIEVKISFYDVKNWERRDHLRMGFLSQNMVPHGLKEKEWKHIYIYT